MSFSFRVFFIDKSDKIKRIPNTRFNRLRRRDPQESLPEYKSSRIRYIRVTLELENRKPISIVHYDCGYLLFDHEGRVDQKFLDEEGHTAMDMVDSTPLPDKPENLVQAGHKFSRKRFENQFRWTLSSELGKTISQKVFK